jgi:hypothetical protein
MTEPQAVEKDPALDALASLSEVSASSAEDLNALHGDLVTMQRRRRRGWSWRRIVSSYSGASPLATAASTLANLGRALGGFRRAIVGALRTEGMQVSEIAELLEVSRQRVSALVRRKH